MTLKSIFEKHGIPYNDKGKVGKEELEKITPLLKEDELFHIAKLLADKCISSKYIMKWDDLPDINSLWDYIYIGMSKSELIEAVKDACNDRIESMLD